MNGQAVLAYGRAAMDAWLIRAMAHGTSRRIDMATLRQHLELQDTRLMKMWAARCLDRDLLDGATFRIMYLQLALKELLNPETEEEKEMWRRAGF